MVLANPGEPHHHIFDHFPISFRAKTFSKLDLVLSLDPVSVKFEKLPQRLFTVFDCGCPSLFWDRLTLNL